MKTFIAIIEDGLQANGFSGLRSGDGCGCRLGELVPCDSDPTGCLPGYFKTKPGAAETWAIWPTDSEPSAEQWQAAEDAC